MKDIKLKKLIIENFKGIKSLEIDFSNTTTISGQNALGKTTIFDSLTWLLFNKNSNGDTTFQVRPLDEKGNQIDNIEISVAATFLIDDEEVELLKTQKQNWVKHRGDLEKKFEGNVNTYEVDGYPKTEKEYKSFVSGIVDEEIFKLITNPQAFSSMPWKEQRAILMKFVPDISDVELAKKNPLFLPLVNDLEKASNVDDIKAKFLKAKKELNKTMTELPARIDEIAKMKVVGDPSSLKEKKKEIELKISELGNSSSDVNSELEKLRDKSMRLQMSINALFKQANDELVISRREIESKINVVEADKRNVSVNIDLTNHDIEVGNRVISENEKRREGFGKEYYALIEEQFDESKWVFDEESTICSLCGQKLPEDKISELIASFENKKEKAKSEFERNLANRKKELIELGNECKRVEESTKENIKKLEIKITELDSELISLESQLVSLKDELSKIPEKPNMTGNKEYNDFVSEYESVLKNITELESKSMEEMSNNSAVETAKNDLNRELEEITAELSKFENNSNIDARIEELETEQIEIAQKIADQEKMIYLLEEFIKEKMNVISNEINKHFKLVKFNLFKTYQNGGIEPCCEVTYNGIPYSVLNSGHRIVSGLDIINSLCELYDVSAPVFTDNAESINDYNIPIMKCQMVLLKVTDDKKLLIGGN